MKTDLIRVHLCRSVVTFLEAVDLEMEPYRKLDLSLPEEE